MALEYYKLVLHILHMTHCNINISVLEAAILKKITVNDKIIR